MSQQNRDRKIVQFLDWLKQTYKSSHNKLLTVLDVRQFKSNPPMSECSDFLTLHAQALGIPQDPPWVYSLEKDTRPNKPLPSAGAAVAFSPSPMGMTQFVKNKVLPILLANAMKDSGPITPTEFNYVFSILMLEGLYHSTVGYFDKSFCVYNDETYTLTSNQLVSSTVDLINLRQGTQDIVNEQHASWTFKKQATCFGKNCLSLIRRAQGVAIVKARALAEAFAPYLLRAAQLANKAGDKAGAVLVMLKATKVSDKLTPTQAKQCWSFVLNGMLQYKNSDGESIPYHGIDNIVLTGLAQDYVYSFYNGKQRQRSSLPTTNPQKATILTSKEVWDIIKTLAEELNVSLTIALSLVYCFFICGGHNKVVQPDFTICLKPQSKDFGSSGVYMSKQQLMGVYTKCLGGNKRLRSLGETLGPYICEYAAKHRLNSDVCWHLNTLALALGLDPLSPTECSYALSVMDKDLVALSEKSTVRLSALMALHNKINFG